MGEVISIKDWQGNSGPPAGWCGTWTRQSPYSPLQLTSEKERILRPLINLFKKRYELKYLKNMQKRQKGN